MVVPSQDVYRSFYILKGKIYFINKSAKLQSKTILNPNHSDISSVKKIEQFKASSHLEKMMKTAFDSQLKMVSLIVAPLYFGFCQLQRRGTVIKRRATIKAPFDWSAAGESDFRDVRGSSAASLSSWREEENFDEAVTFVFVPLTPKFPATISNWASVVELLPVVEVELFPVVVAEVPLTIVVEVPFVVVVDIVIVDMLLLLLLLSSRNVVSSSTLVLVLSTLLSDDSLATFLAASMLFWLTSICFLTFSLST